MSPGSQTVPAVAAAGGVRSILVGQSNIYWYCVMVVEASFLQNFTLPSRSTVVPAKLTAEYGPAFVPMCLWREPATGFSRVGWTRAAGISATRMLSAFSYAESGVINYLSQNYKELSLTAGGRIPANPALADELAEPPAILFVGNNEAFYTSVETFTGSAYVEAVVDTSRDDWPDDDQPTTPAIPSDTTIDQLSDVAPLLAQMSQQIATLQTAVNTANARLGLLQYEPEPTEPVVIDVQSIADAVTASVQATIPDRKIRIAESALGAAFVAAIMGPSGKRR